MLPFVKICAGLSVNFTQKYFYSTPANLRRRFYSKMLLYRKFYAKLSSIGPVLVFERFVDTNLMENPGASPIKIA